MKVLKIIILLVCLLLAFIPLKGQLFGYSHLAGRFFDFLHFPFFAILSVSILGVNSKIDASKKYRLLILLSSVVFIELIQSFTGRSASITDVAWGGGGIACGWAWHAPKPRGLYWVAGLVSCYTAVLWLNLHILFLSGSRLPVVSEVDSMFTTYLFDNMNEIKTPKFKKVWSDELGSDVLKGSKVDYYWSGFSYKFPLYADLDRYTLLRMDYYSPISFKELDVRFNSVNGREIYTLYNVKRGWNKLLININSVDRQGVDWSEITGFAVFYESKNGPDTYLVDNIIFQ